MSYTLTNEGCQPHLFAHIEEALAEWGWLVPAWVDTIRVTFNGDEGAATDTIACQISYEYRSVHLQVCNGWTKVREEERGRWVMHELLHIHVNHIFETYHELLRATTQEGEPLNRWAEEQGRKAIERTTNDLERVLWERLESFPRMER